tara:strand:- start:2794 stop:3132 length:339 start_codon:yes stop_codon:yes gene_type:complete
MLQLVMLGDLLLRFVKALCQIGVISLFVQNLYYSRSETLFCPSLEIVRVAPELLMTPEAMREGIIWIPPGALSPASEVMAAVEPLRVLRIHCITVFTGPISSLSHAFREPAI